MLFYIDFLPRSELGALSSLCSIYQVELGADRDLLTLGERDL